MNRKKSIIISLIIAITGAVIIMAVMVINGYNYNISVFEENTVENYNEQYETILHGYRQLSRAYYDKINSNEEILEIIWKAGSADEEERNYLRDELHELSIVDYERAVNNYFRQYQFILSDNTSLLRMHKPEKFGDNLQYARDSVRIANEEERFVEGFEEGRVFNGYRFVYPLFYNGESIGCVEISLSYASITKLMVDLFDAQSIFILKHSIVEEKVFKELIDTNYILAPFASDYYIDNETIEYVHNNSNNCLFNAMSEDQIIKEEISRLDDGNTFFFSMSHEEKEYCIVFLNIDNIADEHAGYLVFINNCTLFYNHEATFMLQIIMLVVMWAMMIFIVWLFVFNRRKLEKVTYYDKLTGAYNRNKLYETAKNEMQRDARYKHNLSLILFDIDKFKNINDTYGHIMGDKVLRKIAASCLSNIRENDILFRYGGDEFLILLPNTDLLQAKQIAQKINLLLEKESRENLYEPITVSMGVAQYNRDETFEQLIHRADTMLYKAKHKGRNCVVADDEQNS